MDGDDKYRQISDSHIPMFQIWLLQRTWSHRAQFAHSEIGPLSWWPRAVWFYLPPAVTGIENYKCPRSVKTTMRTWFGRGKKLQRAVTSCCLCAFILYGYEQGVFGGVLENEDWLRQFNDPDPTLTGLITGSYNIGALLGCFLNFLIGETLGRRRTIWFAMAWIITGAVLQASAYSLPHLIVGRIITGIGTGLKTSTVPM